MNRNADLQARFPNASPSFLRLNPPARFPEQTALDDIILKTMTKATPQPAKRRKTVRNPLVAPSESQSQQAVIRWWALVAAEHKIPEHALMAFPLQGVRTARNGARMKAEGMRRGTPDLLLTIQEGYLNPKGPWIPGPAPCLWIEMKSARGSLSPHQKAMLKTLFENGHATVVCRSTQEAIQAITGYLQLPTPE